MLQKLTRRSAERPEDRNPWELSMSGVDLLAGFERGSRLPRPPEQRGNPQRPRRFVA